MTLREGGPSFTFGVRTESGDEGGYQTNCSGGVQITALPGMRIEVTGSISTEANSDCLSVFDVVDDSAVKIFEGSGEQQVSVKSSENKIIIRFSSDEMTQGDGVDLQVTFVQWVDRAVNVDPAEGGTVVANTDYAYEDDTVTLTINPDEGYVLKSLIYKDDKENVHPISNATWYSNTASFIMPRSGVNVIPTFIKTESASGLVYYLKDGSSQLTVPEGISSFTVISTEKPSDEEQNYSFNGELSITAPEACRIKVSTEQDTDENNRFVLYDGENSSASAISPIIGTTDNIGCLGVYIEDARDYSLQCTVTIADGEPHAITVNQVPGGTVAVSDNITSAKKKQKITVTATPDHEKGFVLSGIRVVDEDGNNVKVESGNWYAGNAATFIMPDKAVSIQADFTNDLTAEGGLSVDMPYSSKNIFCCIRHKQNLYSQRRYACS